MHPSTRGLHSIASDKQSIWIALARLKVLYCIPTLIFNLMHKAKSYFGRASILLPYLQVSTVMNNCDATSDDMKQELFGHTEPWVTVRTPTYWRHRMQKWIVTASEAMCSLSSHALHMEYDVEPERVTPLMILFPLKK